jgi:hypothetical protein
MIKQSVRGGLPRQYVAVCYCSSGGRVEVFGETWAAQMGHELQVVFELWGEQAARVMLSLYEANLVQGWGPVQPSHPVCDFLCLAPMHCKPRHNTAASWSKRQRWVRGPVGIAVPVPTRWSRIEATRGGLV